MSRSGIRRNRQGSYARVRHGTEVPVEARAVPAEDSRTQPRRNQLSTMGPDELCSLRQDANEVQWEEVRLVYDLLEPQQLILVIIWRLNYPKHLLDHRAGQVAGRGQLQST